MDSLSQEQRERHEVFCRAKFQASEIKKVRMRRVLLRADPLEERRLSGRKAACKAASASASPDRKLPFSAGISLVLQFLQTIGVVLPNKTVLIMLGGIAKVFLGELVEEGWYTFARYFFFFAVCHVM